MYNSTSTTKNACKYRACICQGLPDEQLSHFPHHQFRRPAALVLVDEGAMLPDLALGSGLDLDGAHLDHGAREDLEEELGVVDDAEDVGLGGGVGDERGVGLEQAPPLEHVAVVAQVEGPEAPRVHLGDRRVVRQRLAPLPQLRRVRRVQRRVRVHGARAPPREIVQPLAERVAVGDADRVSPCIHAWFIISIQQSAEAVAI